MPDTIRTGLDMLLAAVPATLHGARVGLLTNPNGINGAFEHAVDLLAEMDSISLVALFGPEHGVRGEAQAGEHVTSSRDPKTRLPIHSLYGETRRPTAEMLAGIDAIIVDLQDIAVRYTTYPSTVFHLLDACDASDIAVVVLDRPNPLNGDTYQGNLLDAAFRSFVGGHTVPIRHGLTLGELATLYAREQGLREPTVIAMDGWRRSMWFDETGLPWVPPSPNLPTLDAVTLYPATCLIEGTNLSEGRGTTKPFEVIGAPWVDPDALMERLRRREAPGVAFRPLSFVPTFSKHAGDRCGGVQIHMTDRTVLDSPALGIHLLTCLHSLVPDHFSWIAPNDDARPYFIDLLAGTADLRQAIDRGDSPSTIVEAWREQAEMFRERHDSVAHYDS